MFDLAKIEKKHPYFMRTVEVIIVLILSLYPLRHIHRGLDLWDVGYNYANFEYMGVEHMDPMWLFSTYIATAVGHLFTFLPFGKTLLGLNFYTGMTVSIVAVLAYVFCTRDLKMPKVAVFLGEFVAISFCWCPTALLYNYLTYIFMLIMVILLYRGLTTGRNRALFFAGIALGINVFVRFSNLPEVIFIFAVWVYGILETVPKLKDESEAVKKRERSDALARTGKRTLLCFLGFMSAVVIIAGYICIRYGFSEFITGIERLFAISKSAPNYSAKKMISVIFRSYYTDSYWLIRVAFFAFVGMILCAIGKHADSKLGIKKGVNGLIGKNITCLHIAYAASIVCAAASIVWLNVHEFRYDNYYEYGAITRPGNVLLLFILIVAIIDMFNPKVTLNNKLLAGLVFIIVMITPIGSNTALFPAYNNLFFPMPWFVWRLWQFLKIQEWPAISNLKENKKKMPNSNWLQRFIKVALSHVSLFAMKATAVVLTATISFWIVAFGSRFVFAEAKNADNPYYTMKENRTIRSIRMSYSKADDLYGIWNYIKDNELQDRELITYGYIPALSFYLQMPAAFNPWMDLLSYGIDTMDEELVKVVSEAEAGKDYPVIIIRTDYAANTELFNSSEFRFTTKYFEVPELKEEYVEKWEHLRDFMDNTGYKLAYYNSYYAVYTN